MKYLFTYIFHFKPSLNEILISLIFDAKYETDISNQGISPLQTFARIDSYFF